MSKFVYSGAPMLPCMFAGLGGATPAPTGTIVAWWDFTNAATTFSDTAGTTPAVDGGNLSCVKDARGGANPSAVAAAGSSGYVGDGTGVHPLTYHSADTDGKPYGLIPTFGDQMLISSASITYNAVLLVVRAGDSQFSFHGDFIFDDSQAGHTNGLVNGYPGTSVLAGQDNGFTSKIPTGGTFYAEDGSIAHIDSVHSQAAGLDEYHVITVLYASARTGYVILGNQFTGFAGFAGGRYKEIVMLSGADDATIKANVAYLHTKHCAGYTSKQVIFDGDSVFEAAAVLSAIDQEVPQRAMAIIADGGLTGWHLQNAAIHGQTLAEMVTRQPWNVIDKFPQRSKNVVVAMEWINSYLGGQTAAQINASFDSYIAPVIAAGVPLVFCTPTFIGGETTSGNETDRQTIRTHIQGAAGLAAVSDIGGPLSPFGQVVLGGPCSSRYYDDGSGIHLTHPTDDGTAVLANIVATSLGPVLATSDSVSNPAPSVLHAIVDPVSGPAGTAVKIYLANLPNTVTSIEFSSGHSATGVTWQAGYRVDCTTPSGVAGAADIIIHYGSSQSITIPGGFTFTAADPTTVTDLALWMHVADLSNGTIATWTDKSSAAHVFTAAGTPSKAASPNRVTFVGANPDSLTNSDSFLPGRAWLAFTSFATGETARPVTVNGKYFTATTGGTTGATEPTWPTTIGNTVTDGSVVWTCTGTMAFTIGLLFKLNSLPGSGTFQVLADLFANNQGAGDNFQLAAMNLGGYQNISFLVGGTAVGINPTLDTAEHTLFITYDGTTVGSSTAAYTCYLDGVAQTVNASSAFGSTGGNTIGARTGPSSPFDGKTGDIAAWRHALNSTEIASMHAYLLSA